MASNHQLTVGGMEHRVQRLDGGGTRLWGAGGSLVWQNSANIWSLVAGSSGDAFAIASTNYGDAKVQHLDATGAPTWAAAGITVLDTATYPNPNLPVACADGAGGFTVVAGVEDLVAQRVTAAGATVWGAGVTLTSLPGWQTNAAVTPDGFGGLLVVYADHYYSAVTDPYAHALSARRLDGFGTVLWGNDGFWWTLLHADPDWRVADPQIVADGSGGAQVVWPQYDDSWNRNTAYAAGLGPAGSSPPVPTLTAMWPDGGAPGEVLGVLALGDYLDAGMDYALVRDGVGSVPLTGVTVAGGKLLAATLDLGGAAPGAYALVAREGGPVVAELPDAFGVGVAPVCAEDRPMGLPDQDPVPFGSQRKAAFGPDGRARYAWLAYDPAQGRWGVNLWVGDDHGGSVTTVHRSNVPLRDLSLAVGPGGEPHLVFVADDGASEVLHYLRDGADHAHLFTDGVRSPCLAVDEAGLAMIVFESDIMGASWLFWMAGTDAGLGPQTDLISGAGATQPDVALADGGFMLTYVRDFWVPGLREVCRQRCEGLSWQQPVGITFGVTITSPSVAWDGAGRLLFAWVLDNAGGQPLLHTMLMTDGTAGPVRWRGGLPLVYRCSVAASGPRAFRLLTQESGSGIPMEVYLRSGDGNVFHARRRVNSRDDVDFPVLAAEPAGSGLFAAWLDHDLVGEPVSCYFCRSPVSAVVPAAAGIALDACPNPFNPRTEFRFGLAQTTTATLAVHDTRGRLVRRLHAGPLAAGEHRFVWDGRDDAGRRQPSGVYCGRLAMPGEVRAVKVLLLK